MGLTSIHHPDALLHFNRVTHCPWCGKEGQNEGMDNALQVRPGVQEVLSLSLGHIQGHPVPWLEELPAIHGRRP